MRKRIASIVLSVCLCFTLLPTAALAEVEGESTSHTHCLCGKTHTDIGDHKAEDKRTFTAWTADNALPSETGNYYLTQDVDINATWCPANGTVLCLNRHTITMNGEGSSYGLSAIQINSGTTFALTDCAAAAGKITHGEGKIGSGVSSYGVFNLYGGEISGNSSNWQYFSGGGIYIGDSGTLNMYGGKICNNSAPDGGGGVANRGTFSMYGGEISGNSTTNREYGGGGVLNMLTFHMYGGTIRDNSGNGSGLGNADKPRPGNGNAVAVISGGTFSGEIRQNNGYVGSKVSITGGTFPKINTVSVSDKNTQPNLRSLLANEYVYQATDGSGTLYCYNDMDFTATELENVKVVRCPHTPDGDGKCQHCKVSIVAQIGTTYYTSLTTAIEAARAGDTVKLLRNVTGDFTCASKDFTLDLNGKTLSSLTVSGTAIKVKDGVGGGKITLTTSNGVNVFDLLEAGYAFKSGSTWYDRYNKSTATSVTDAEVKPVPMTGVSIATAGSTTLVYGYADAPTFTAAPTGIADGASVTYTWYVDNDEQLEIGNTFPFPTGKSVTAYKVKCDADVDGYVVTSDEITVTIDKATPTITGATATVTYGDTPTGGIITATTGGVVGSFEWNVTSYGDASETPKTLQATFKPKDTTNYNSVEKIPVSVTVNRATYNDTKTATGSAKYGATGKVDLSSYKAAGGSFGAVTKIDTEGVLSGAPYMDGDTLKFTFVDEATYANKTATIKVPVNNATNYNDYEITVTVTVEAKTPQDTLTIHASKTTVTYGETVTLSYEGGSGNGAVTYTITDGAANLVDNKLTPAEVGTVKVMASKVGDATYADADSTPIIITVNKATVTVTALDRSIYVNGTAPDLSNPAKGTDYTVTGLVGADTLGGTITMEYQKDGSTVATPDVATTGSYDIVISGETADSDKYNAVVFENGTLTISNRPSSGGGGSSKPTVTVPISSDHATVEVKAEVSKGNATVSISDKQIKKVIADHAGEVTIDVSGLKNVDSATVPSHVVEKTNEAENTGLTVALPAGSITLDETALGSVTENADGKDVTVSVVAVPTANLSPVVKDIIGMEPTVLAVVDVNVTISGKKQSTFDGGKITVSVPYTPKAGEDTGKLTVWFIRDDGTIENKGGYYDAKNKCFVFETDHLSQYILVNTNEMQIFEDVPTDAYFANAVSWAAGKGITGGIGNNLFAPDASCTRAQIVTFLWRAAGSPEPKTASSFSDVSANAYYAKAVAWAVENGITGGIGNNQFAPDLTCTRAQAAAFLFRYAAANGMEAVTLQELVGGYSDAAQVPSYALPAFNWALARGIVNGNNGNLMPNNDCTRAQIVTMLYRLLGTN